MAMVKRPAQEDSELRVCNSDISTVTFGVASLNGIDNGWVARKKIFASAADLS
jgi:hypothetical protein